MATPGDPFETKELDQTRSRQRRILRELPDWLLEHLHKEREPVRVEADREERRLVESAVRELADDHVRRTGLESTLAGLAKTQTRRRVFKLLLSRDHLPYLAQEVEQEPVDEVRDLPPGQVQPTFAFLELLLMADELAEERSPVPQLR